MYKRQRVNVLNMGIADNTPMGKMMVTVMLALAAPTYTAGLLGAATMRRNGAGPNAPAYCT